MGVLSELRMDQRIIGRSGVGNVRAVLLVAPLHAIENLVGDVCFVFAIQNDATNLIQHKIELFFLGNCVYRFADLGANWLEQLLAHPGDFPCLTKLLFLVLQEPLSILEFYLELRPHQLLLRSCLPMVQQILEEE